MNLCSPVGDYYSPDTDKSWTCTCNSWRPDEKKNGRVDMISVTDFWQIKKESWLHWHFSRISNIYEQSVFFRLRYLHQWVETHHNRKHTRFRTKYYSFDFSCLFLLCETNLNCRYLPGNLPVHHKVWQTFVVSRPPVLTNVRPKIFS